MKKETERRKRATFNRTPTNKTLTVNKNDKKKEEKTLNATASGC